MGKRGPPPMHPHLRLLRGDGRPSRMKPPIAATIAPELPPPPAFLTGYALEQWHAVAPELFRLQLLSVLDVQPLAAWAVAAGRWRSAREALLAVPESDRLLHLLDKIVRNSARQMLTLGQPLGLAGPASRARLVGPGKKPPGKFTGYLGEPA